MRMIAPDGQVYQAGTLSGNPLAVAAGRTTLGILESNPDIFSELEGTGKTLGLGLEALGREYGVPIRWQSSGGMGCPFFSETPVTDWQSSAATDSQAFNRFFTECSNAISISHPAALKLGFGQTRTRPLTSIAH